MKFQNAGGKLHLNNIMNGKNGLFFLYDSISFQSSLGNLKVRIRHNKVLKYSLYSRLHIL